MGRSVTFLPGEGFAAPYLSSPSCKRSVLARSPFPCPLPSYRKLHGLPAKYVPDQNVELFL